MKISFARVTLKSVIENLSVSKDVVAQGVAPISKIILNFLR